MIIGGGAMGLASLPFQPWLAEKTMVDLHTVERPPMKIITWSLSRNLMIFFDCGRCDRFKKPWVSI